MKLNNKQKAMINDFIKNDIRNLKNYDLDRRKVMTESYKNESLTEVEPRMQRKSTAERLVEMEIQESIFPAIERIKEMMFLEMLGHQGSNVPSWARERMVEFNELNDEEVFHKDRELADKIDEQIQKYLNDMFDLFNDYIEHQ